MHHDSNSVTVMKTIPYLEKYTSLVQGRHQTYNQTSETCAISAGRGSLIKAGQIDALAATLDRGIDV